MDTPTHPLQIVLREPALERSRLTTFFRLILFIPHAIWWVIWGIGIVVVLPVQWVWALIVGGSTGLQMFYGQYIRYTVQLYGYLCLAANPWPTGILGESEYPVDVAVPEKTRQNRWTIFFRLILVLPPYILAGALLGGGGGGGGSYSVSSDSSGTSFSAQSYGPGLGIAVLVAIGAWFVIMARGRTTTGLRDLVLYAIGYSAQVYAYFTIVTGVYPNSTPALASPVPGPEHPITITDEGDLRRSRLTVFFRGLLFVPHYIWLSLWGFVVAFVVIFNWFAVLFSARTPDAFHRFLGAYLRYQLHVFAFLSLAANPFPGFVGKPGTYPIDLHVAEPERQNRWTVFFRLILLWPASVLAFFLSVGVMLTVSIGAWFVGLFTGRMPPGLRDLLAFCLRYHAQLGAYQYILTDQYPYTGPTLATGAVPEVAPPPVAPTGLAPEGWAPPAAPPDWTTNPESV
jgi:hypothetical protein